MIRVYLKPEQVCWGRFNESRSYTCILSSEIIEWLKENIEKVFIFDYNFIAGADEFTCFIDPRNILNLGLIYSYIDFESISDAVLFKLRWL
jgi:hypothetical protein